MINGHTCETCAFFQLDERVRSPGRNPVGMCRRNAPKVLAHPNDGMAMTRFPITEIGGACGDHSVLAEVCLEFGGEG